jgi:sugar/nucleoside kinase (ribokinase family)
MTAAILGHLVLDEIHRHNGEVVESLGGIFFPVGAFGALADAGDLIRPIFPVGRDAWEQYSEAIGAFPRIDPSAHSIVDRPNTRVRLFHDAQAQYNTQLVSSLDPIDIDAAAPHLRDADLVYLNMMTGHDLLIDDAARLRAVSKGLVYLDLHMIAYRVARDGHRTTARVADWRRWANVPHVLQCNERELAVLGDADVPPDARIASLFDDSSLDMIVVTRGERGSTVYRRHQAALDLPASPVDAMLDSTGCGDVFGSTFAYHLAKGYALEEAGAMAARAAAFVASIPGSIGIGGIRNHIALEQA